MKISKENFLSLRNGDTIVLSNRIYDVLENDSSKTLLFLVRHGLVQDINSLPADLQQDFIVQFNYKGHEKEKIKVLGSNSKIENFLKNQEKGFCLENLYSGFNLLDDVIMEKDFKSLNSLTPKVFDLDEHMLKFQEESITISNIIYSKKLGLFLFRFEQDEKQRDWFGDTIFDIDTLPF